MPPPSRFKVIPHKHSLPRRTQRRLRWLSDRAGQLWRFEGAVDRYQLSEQYQVVVVHVWIDSQTTRTLFLYYDARAKAWQGDCRLLTDADASVSVSATRHTAALTTLPSCPERWPHTLRATAVPPANRPVAAGACAPIIEFPTRFASKGLAIAYHYEYAEVWRVRYSLYGLVVSELEYNGPILVAQSGVHRCDEWTLRQKMMGGEFVVPAYFAYYLPIMPVDASERVVVCRLATTTQRTLRSLEKRKFEFVKFYDGEIAQGILQFQPITLWCDDDAAKAILAAYAGHKRHLQSREQEAEESQRRRLEADARQRQEDAIQREVSTRREREWRRRISEIVDAYDQGQPARIQCRPRENADGIRATRIRKLLASMRANGIPEQQIINWLQ